MLEDGVPDLTWWRGGDIDGFLVQVTAGLDTNKSLCLLGGAVAQQVPVQAIQVHQAPQQASPSRDSSTDLTQTSSSGTGIARSSISLLFCLLCELVRGRGPALL